MLGVFYTSRAQNYKKVGEIRTSASLLRSPIYKRKEADAKKDAVMERGEHTSPTWHEIMQRGKRKNALPWVIAKTTQGSRHSGS